ncbi:LysR family transcriptional regulator [Burkholderia cepacia]|uniref:LysR family transcriptional regulator n=1 Tax=Burkholderia cepacia TaxID=292 RepID=A0AAX2RVI2_BURCE|nr:LysR family transcriptional regulator [Burkholderia cepacia]TES69420.1 LysR family transcriptional regulator [Burkholderia cepacia]TET02519.1 LysR family transcriptional regulator [Burkholderia cepacia]TEU49897.1 LysR family transcriptional regulator [Burkholderia cepacia]TEU54516.1 LysR family transcriptional regulator [Burkholderia cepacia]TEU58716.1 LysR family transcriptional regulator [Burkholderia cepacia]
MVTLQHMRLFVGVVNAGGFSAAARQLGVSTTRVSRMVSDLERHLTVRLLNRTTRRVSLTDAGERYWRRCDQILAYLEQAEAETCGAHARPSGKLKLHCSNGLDRHHVMSLVAAYRQRFPEVRIDLLTTGRRPDLIGEGLDVSISLERHPPESGQVSERIGATFGILCASRGYVDTHGVPATLQDLERHACLGLMTTSTSHDAWNLIGPDGVQATAPVTPAFRVNDADALAAGIRGGMGIGLLPLYSAVDGLRDGQLTCVLPHYRTHDMNVYVLYSSRQYLDAKIRTWVDLMRDAVPSMLARDEQTFAAYAGPGADVEPARLAEDADAGADARYAGAL